jgi:putative ABC transport system ATP-binding protein
MNNQEAHIRLRDVVKTYETATPCTALKGINLEIEDGEFIAIVGASGSGKSTLLNMLTGIDRPTTGTIHIGQTLVHALTESEMSIWRGRNVGVVFQFFQLLPTLTAVENVMLPMDFCNTWPGRTRRSRALALLERVGVADQANKLPETLSGGQQQRVAIARALANDPPLVVADEPTGNLDSKTSASVLQLFAALSNEDKTVVMVTHERDVSALASRTITLADGMVASTEAGTHE